jgi:glycosyltransferase involved in cell wall biosynthesis
MVKEPLFTVVIPAKDRADYLYHTLRTCALQDYENLEVIVSDDGSTDHTRSVVESASKADPRIRYVSPGTGVGMRENFEFALRQVRPGYVIALGADDGLLPHAIQGMLQVMRSTGQELLAWPTPIFSYAGARSPTSQLMLYRRDKVRVIEAQHFLANQVEHLNYLGDIESPMFYVKGVASTELIDRVKGRSSDGRFYCCPTPDGYSGIVLAGEVSTYAFSGKPFSIYGVSPSSQGMSYLAGDEQARKRSEAFFQNVADAPMHASLASQPYSPLISLMTADYLLTAATLPGWPGKFPSINYKRLLQKAVGELGHGLFSENRLARELNILHGIAALHGLGDFFNETLGRTRRYAKKDHFAGNGLGPGQFYLDSDMYGLHNIFDAAYFAYCAHEFLPKVSLSMVVQAMCNSLRYRLRSRRRGEPFPIESIWRTELKGP